MADRVVALPRGIGGRQGVSAVRARVSSIAFADERLLVLGLMLIGLVVHGLNMFHYPAFTLLDDEGIYMSQAWAILREHQLAPYTYFYDHAPGGWILIAAWMWLTGGVRTFGPATDSGRVLMLLLHVASVPLLYRVCRKLGCGPAVAALAALFFDVSPLAVFFQRMVLLDNIMNFWILLSLDLLLDGWGRLSRVALSGICCGIALLSKETAIFLTPALFFIVIQQRWRHQGAFGIGGWLLPMIAVASLYPLYAMLKAELLPAGEAIRFFVFNVYTKSANVSLIDAVKWQSTRTGGGMLNIHNLFWQLVWTEWMPRDPILLVGGSMAVLLNLVRGIRDRRALAVGLLGILPLYYLARGGVVFNYYILFAIPFLCLNLAVLVQPLFERLPGRMAGGLAAVIATALVLGYWRVGTLSPLFTEHPDTAGNEAVSWIKQHVPSQSLIITRDPFWTDLHEPGEGGPSFPGAHSHWKVALDPSIRSGVFHDSWQTVDYIIMTPGLENDFKTTDDTVALDAYAHAHLVKSWSSPEETTHLHLHQIVELWKVDKPGPTEDTLLAGSDNYMNAKFDRSGAFAGNDGTVTSGSEADAMLRAVWSGDKTGFYQTWKWTQANLVNSDGLLAWQWQRGKVTDPHSASDADSDTALALLMAGKRWNDPVLIDAGRSMVGAIWDHEVATVSGSPYLTAGNWAVSDSVIALNPSYFSPYSYHIFQEVDPDHDWLGLIDSSYQTLFAASADPLGGSKSAGLPPDWVGLDPTTGELVPLPLDSSDPTQYGYDAARAYWRIALDLRWNHDGRAQTFLQQAGFLRDEVNRKGLVSSVYAHDGSVVQTAPSTVGTSGAMSALLTLDPAGASSLYSAQLLGGATKVRSGDYWADPNDLYTQEWGWFATGLYSGELTDLWHNP